MTSLWWYLARSSGIVATVLIAATLGWGLIFSARGTGRRLRPAWWLDLHNWLGGLALAFTMVHVVTVVADSDLGIRLVDVIVPGTASYRTMAMALGVVAFELVALATLTSLRPLKARLTLRVWHAIHLASVPAAVLTGLHAYQAGTDATRAAFKLGLAVLAGAAVYPAALRVLGLRRSRPA